jgi:hypothetical protein
MTLRHGACNCIWAIPTLFLDAPLWLEAADRPWTCRRVSPPRTLELTDECRDCPRWEPVSAAAVGESWADAEPHPLLTDVIARRF